MRNWFYICLLVASCLHTPAEGKYPRQAPLPVQAPPVIYHDDDGAAACPVPAACHTVPSTSYGVIYTMSAPAPTLPVQYHGGGFYGQPVTFQPPAPVYRGGNLFRGGMLRGSFRFSGGGCSS